MRRKRGEKGFEGEDLGRKKVNVVVEEEGVGSGCGG